MNHASRIEPIIERLHRLHPRLIDLSLDRLQRLLAQLGHPERRLPPVIHVAGTNGKGSTCAFLRAVAEAAGWRTHVFTSPHLVRFTERYVVAGREVTDAALADVLARIEAMNGEAPITVFEVITAAAFELFAATPARLCILEVGLGGRGDATNVVPPPAACAITSISLDHREMLGDTLALIAGEKAGIIKPGVPVVTGAQDPEALAVLREVAQRVGAPFLPRGEAWDILPDGDDLRYVDDAGTLRLPRPNLLGEHQVDNAGIAVAALRAAGLGLESGWDGIAWAVWPARLDRLHGALARRLPDGWELWLDGGHNPGGGLALAAQMAAWADRPIHLVLGMKQSKDAAEFLRPMLPHAASVWAVEEPGQHLAMPVADVVAASGGAARPGPTVQDTLAALRREHGSHGGKPARVLLCGSLYLAGEVLKLDQSGKVLPGDLA